MRNALISILLFMGLTAFGQLSSVIVPNPTPNVEAPSPDSTVLSFAQYLFNNDVTDASGNGNDLTGAPDSYEGSSPVWEGSYSAKYEYSTFSTLAMSLFDNDTVYISAHFYNPSAETDRAHHRILEAGNSTDGILVEYDGINNRMEVHRYVSSADNFVITSASVSEDAWTHFVAQFIGTTCNLYLNNSLANSAGTTLTGGFYNTGTGQVGESLESYIDDLQFGNGILTTGERQLNIDDPGWLIKR